MQIIPVIDLAGGRVVRAVRGQRADYRPIESVLCRSSEPCRVARTLLDHCAASVLYVADIDALRGGRAQTDALERLRAALPGIEIWLDAGFDGITPMPALGMVPVYGTESLASEAAYDHAMRTTDGAVLSLDHRHERPLAHCAALGSDRLDADRWPTRVIVMTLDQVGSESGPDLATFSRLRARSETPRRWFGAGGVRNAADLQAAARAGADGWLVASALHDLRIAAPTLL